MDRAILDEGFHGLNQVASEIKAMAFAVLYKSVSDAGEFTSTPGAKEEVILRSDFQRTNGVLAEVVIKFDPAIAEIGIEAAPLVEGVGDGLAHEAFREVTGFDLFEVATDEP